MTPSLALTILRVSVVVVSVASKALLGDQDLAFVVRRPRALAGHSSGHACTLVILRGTRVWVGATRGHITGVGTRVLRVLLRRAEKGADGE